MRTSYWLVAGALVAAAFAFAFWSPRSHHPPTPPGQFRLHDRRPQARATPSLGLYRPRGRGDQDVLAPSAHRDAKMRCATETGCALPTAPLGPQYSPTILMNA